MHRSPPCRRSGRWRPAGPETTRPCSSPRTCAPTNGPSGRHASSSCASTSAARWERRSAPARPRAPCSDCSTTPTSGATAWPWSASAATTRELLLAPTSSVEVARNRLRDLTTGGATPLAAGIRAALDVIARDEHPDRALLVLLTDGRATGSPDAVDQALEAAAAARHRGIHALVLDCEDGAVRLGLAGSLATALGARVLPLAGGADDAARLIAAS